MRKLSLLPAFILALMLAPACGGGGDDGDDDDDTATADATPTGNPDAAPTGNPDAAPAGLVGLGQACASPTDCAGTSAPDCISFGGGGGFCSLVCAEGYTVMSNASGQIPAPSDPGPHNICAAAFTGDVGTPACLLIGNLTPADNPVQPNKQYTMDLSCAIACEMGTNACPDSMTCIQGLCSQ